MSSKCNTIGRLGAAKGKGGKNVGHVTRESWQLLLFKKGSAPPKWQRGSWHIQLRRTSYLHPPLPSPSLPHRHPRPLIAQPQWKLLPGNRLSYDTHSAVTGSAQFVAPTRRQLPRDNTEGNSTAGSPIAPRGNVKPVVIYICLIKELTLTVGGNRISQMFLGSFV